jgi:hypothetical protein
LTDPKRSLRAATAAAAEKLGDFFPYVVERPVSLPRQESALLPVDDKGVEASRVSIYNEGTQPKFPLLGLRLKNTSGLHLLRGPVTVYEGGSYAGDARILNLPPHEERLLSYAVGLGTEVKPEVAADSGRLTHLKGIKDVLYTTTKRRQTKTYTVRDRNPQGRAALIGHPVKDQFQLVDTTMLVQTDRDAYRYETQVPAARPRRRPLPRSATLARRCC